MGSRSSRWRAGVTGGAPARSYPIRGGKSFGPDALGVVLSSHGDGRLDSSSAAELRKAERAAPATLLDPFGGAVTVGFVAERLRPDSILIKITSDYADMARKRFEEDAPPRAQAKAAA